jgi:molybdopterin/thiamine biosynthesis adenylyltransferase
MMAYLSRVRGRVDRRRIAPATVAFVGLGSVGAAIAWRIAQLIPRQLILVDGDDYAVENRIRHPLPREYEHMNKAVSMADYIDRELDGIGQITAIPEYVRPDMADDELREQVIEPATLIVVATDDVEINRRVALLAREHEVPTVVPAIAADGRRGEVFVSLTRDLPCIVCCDGFRAATDPVRNAVMLSTDIYPTIALSIRACLGLLDPSSFDAEMFAPLRRRGPTPQHFRVWAPASRDLQTADDGRAEVQWRANCRGCGGGPHRRLTGTVAADAPPPTRLDGLIGWSIIAGALGEVAIVFYMTIHALASGNLNVLWMFLLIAVVVFAVRHGRRT